MPARSLFHAAAMAVLDEKDAEFARVGRQALRARVGMEAMEQIYRESLEDSDPDVKQYFRRHADWAPR